MRRAPTISLFLTAVALLCFIAQPGLPAGIAGSTMLFAGASVPQEAESSEHRGMAESAIARSDNVRQQRSGTAFVPAVDLPEKQPARSDARTTLPPPPDTRPSAPRAPPAVC